MLGNVIRTYRKKKNLTLDELAKAVGITSGGLSQIERGLVDPSLSALRRISGALNLPIKALFSESGESFVSRRGARSRMVLPDSSIDLECVTPVRYSSGITPTVDALMATLQPGTYGGEALSRHETDACFVVIRGTFVVEMACESVTLEEMDSIYLMEGVQHRLYNPGDQEAVGLFIMAGGVC